MAPFAAMQSRSEERASRRAAIQRARRRAAIWAVIGELSSLTVKVAVVAVALVSLLGVFRTGGPEHRVDIDIAAVPIPIPIPVLVNVDAGDAVELQP